MLESLIFIIFGWPGVLAGLALAAWGVYRRSCLWVLAGAMLTLPITWYIAIGGHFYTFLLLPLSLLAICLIMRRTRRRMTMAWPIFWAAGMLLTLAFVANAPYAAWGQTLCPQFKPWPSTIEFILMTLLAASTLLMPFLIVIVWRQNKSREQSFWMLSVTGITATQMVQMNCDYSAHVASWVWRLNAGLALCCTLAFFIWLGWRWRQDADAMRAHKRNLWFSAFMLFAINFNTVIYLVWH